jgi:hypothetical protein
MVAKERMNSARLHVGQAPVNHRHVSCSGAPCPRRLARQIRLRPPNGVLRPYIYQSGQLAALEAMCRSIFASARQIR